MLVGNCFLPDGSYVMVKRIVTQLCLLASSGCVMCSVTRKLHTKTWNVMDQFVSLFLVRNVSKSSFIAPYTPNLLLIGVPKIESEFT